MTKQKGFTLLELLVVVTILAILAASALVAYDGLSDSAIDSADANNIATLDSAIRTYKVAERVWPTQWDSLLADDGTSYVALDSTLAQRLARYNTNGTFASGLATIFNAVGITQAQAVFSASNDADILEDIVNAAHNEASGASDEVNIDGTFDFTVIATEVATVSGTAVSANLQDGTAVTNGGLYINSISDKYEADEGNLLVAFGFGGDAAGSTAETPAAIAGAPQSGAVTKTKYGRYIALFHVAEDDDGDGDIESGEIETEPHFVGLISPQGKTLTTLLREQKGN